MFWNVVIVFVLEKLQLMIFAVLNNIYSIYTFDDANILVLLIQVNAYDSVHIVDSLYRSKYFLTSMANCNQDLEVSIPASTKIDNRQVNPPTENLEDHGANVPKDLRTDSDEVHKVTILNLPEEVYHPSSEMQGSKKSGGWKQAKVMAQGNGHEGETFGFCSDDFDLCAPILPWVNGDGTINTVVYKGLVRRVLGIVMQNPGILEVSAFAHKLLGCVVIYL